MTNITCYMVYGIQILVYTECVRGGLAMAPLMHKVCSGRKCVHIQGLNTERVACHVTENICSLVHSSPQTPKTIAICRP